MTKVLSLGFDAFGTTESFAHFDEGEGKLHIENRVDVDPLLERNLIGRTSWDGFTPTREAREIADIPVALIHQWLVEEGLDVFQFNRDPETKRKVMQKLRSSDWLKLRSSSGRI